MGDGTSRVVRFRCTVCKKLKRAGADRHWCDDCGGELVRIPSARRKQVKRGW